MDDLDTEPLLSLPPASRSPLDCADEECEITMLFSSCSDIPANVLPFSFSFSISSLPIAKSSPPLSYSLCSWSECVRSQPVGLGVDNSTGERDERRGRGGVGGCSEVDNSTGERDEHGGGGGVGGCSGVRGGSGESGSVDRMGGGVGGASCFLLFGRDINDCQTTVHK